MSNYEAPVHRVLGTPDVFLQKSLPNIFTKTYKLLENTLLLTHPIKLFCDLHGLVGAQVSWGRKRRGDGRCGSVRAGMKELTGKDGIQCQAKKFKTWIVSSGALWEDGEVSWLFLAFTSDSHAAAACRADQRGDVRSGKQLSWQVYLPGLEAVGDLTRQWKGDYRGQFVIYKLHINIYSLKCKWLYKI